MSWHGGTTRDTSSRTYEVILRTPTGTWSYSVAFTPPFAAEPANEAHAVQVARRKANALSAPVVKVTRT